LERDGAKDDLPGVLSPALSDALRAAGFEDIAWQMPEKTGFYQPIVIARAAG
jgi:hypothetical protein